MGHLRIRLGQLDQQPEGVAERGPVAAVRGGHAHGAEADLVQPGDRLVRQDTAGVPLARALGNARKDGPEDVGELVVAAVRRHPGGEFDQVAGRKRGAVGVQVHGVEAGGAQITRVHMDRVETGGVETRGVEVVRGKPGGGVLGRIGLGSTGLGSIGLGPLGVDPIDTGRG